MDGGVVMEFQFDHHRIRVVRFTKSRRSDNFNNNINVIIMSQFLDFLQYGGEDDCDFFGSKSGHVAALYKVNKYEETAT